MSQKSGAARRPDQKGFTDKQGQYLAFIYTYMHTFRRPPAEADMQRHFRVSSPSVHQMVVTLERNGFIRRQPGLPRSIELNRCSRTPAHPRMARNLPVKITVTSY